jgi:hypothetical protein
LLVLIQKAEIAGRIRDLATTLAAKRTIEAR